jgi:hypothetical protein
LDVYDLDESWTPGTPVDKTLLNQIQKENLLEETLTSIDKFDAELKSIFRIRILIR